MIQDLVHRDDADSRAAGPVPEEQTASRPVAAPPVSPPPAPDDSAKPAPADRDLARSSKAELYEVATDLKIAGRSKMSKAELISAIEEAG